ncbi:hypothetical protein CFP56_018191 [Quercus suber]|uniref:RNase H type-1 domain-containing protein n=1 Tax=Quercus suber TaxID=58331 RepID=A0AAW0KMQ6_QUESU
MNVPNKVKYFVWKACRNILATKENLRRRNITKDSYYDVCREHVESTCHLLWFCGHAKDVWSSCKLSFPFEIQSTWDFMDVVWHLHLWEEARPGILERAIMICWGIWKKRNEIIHDGKRQSGLAVVKSSLRLLEDFQAANVNSMPIGIWNQVDVKWVPPLSGCHKVNVDGVVFANRKQVGLGVVIRDEAGQVTAALSKKLDTPLGALKAEAKALEIGVSFAMEVGIRDVTFEGDSLAVCNAVHGLAAIEPSAQNIVTGFLKLVQGFRTFEFSHTKRQGNVPAHVLAQHATNVEDCVVWLEECPGLLESACWHEVTSLNNYE